MILKVENLFASYGKKEVLKGVNIEIYKGEIVSLVGPNGAGKSTLLKSIIGFLKPVEGKILFNGEDITRKSVFERSNMGIGYLSQSGSIFSNLSVEDNLLLASNNHLNNFENVYKLFPELINCKQTRAGLLSGGLKQMLSIANILIRDPHLLLLDEPSAGLAPSIVKSLIERIKEINRTRGITILLVEQNIRQALQISNRAYLMRNGLIAHEEQNPEKLLEEEKFEKVFFEG
jgi:branched-chain amino acid transport system ATP-binding protein